MYSDSHLRVGEQVAREPQADGVQRARVRGVRALQLEQLLPVPAEKR